MHELEFRRSLKERLSARSIDSYVAYCRRVESKLAVDLDDCDLGPDGIRDLIERLGSAGVGRKMAGNFVSALRAYAALAGARPRGGEQVTEHSLTECLLAPGDGSEGPLYAEADEGSADGPMAHATVKELLTTYATVMAELRRRGVVRTGNSPVGDYAEILFSKAFVWTLEGNSAAGYDAVDANGLRYQIKGRQLSVSNASRQLSAIRKIDDCAFDYLAAVLFDPDFRVRRAAIVPNVLVRARARRSDHTNSWIFYLDERVWAEEGVRDVTNELAIAASRL
ncbi:hypothetical protein [Methylobacterium bullatum]|uniref:Core-binding (CB) domain-containing protein n=1 Tax=Methylobacterium bullatum TaxID=570505 RepID=A0A679JYF1_9HYPH|nr:hypothetical protein MBLL_00457 [Methylobacterium bullatum]